MHQLGGIYKISWCRILSMNKCHFYIHSKTISDGYECFFLEIVTTNFKIHAYHAIDFKVAMEESCFTQHSLLLRHELV